MTGELSDTLQSDTVLSGTIGKYDFGGVCRDTSWTGQEISKWTDTQPLLRLSGRAFADELLVRNRYDSQIQEWMKTLPEFRIPHTPFTTIAVNKNFQTALHRDKGDLKAGMGVLTVLAAGTYSGALTVFPAYRFAFDVRTRDVLIADFAGEYHGNTPFIATPGEFERISLVMYYRTKMIGCGMAA
jgi:hypothetical protein